MSDFLLAAAQQGVIASVLRQLGLPSPVRLRRSSGAYQPSPLDKRIVGVISLNGSNVGSSAGHHRQLAAMLQHLGADIVFTEDDAAADPDQSAPYPPADRTSDLKQMPSLLRNRTMLDGLLVDTTQCVSTDSLRACVQAVQDVLPRLRKHGRVLFLTGYTDNNELAAQKAFGSGFSGFSKSLAKEMGRRGVTVNLLRVDPGSLHRLHAPLAFFLSNSSSYVTGQRLTINSLAAAPDQLPSSHLLAGRTAVVTGAAGGIGSTTAKRLADEGAHVLCLDLAVHSDRLDALAKTIGGSTLACDITTPDAIVKLTQWLQLNERKVDVLVHNAGITRDRTFARMTQKEWNSVVDVNLKAILTIDIALLEQNLIADEARLVYLSSISGIAGNFGQTNYAYTKAALIGYVEALSGQLADRGITANAVAPGFIETDMTASLPILVREAGRRLNALSQGGRPEDVAEAIQFLASPASSGISGQTLRVCGGSLLGA